MIRWRNSSPQLRESRCSTDLAGILARILLTSFMLDGFIALLKFSYSELVCEGNWIYQLDFRARNANSGEEKPCVMISCLACLWLFCATSLATRMRFANFNFSESRNLLLCWFRARRPASLMRSLMRRRASGGGREGR